MYTLRFTIDPIHIAQYIITNSDISRVSKTAKKDEIQQLVQFRNKAFSINKTYYDILRRGFQDVSYEITDGKPYYELFSNLSNYLIEISKTDEMSIIVSNIEREKELIEREWASKYKLVSSKLKELDIDGNDEIVTYLLPSQLKAGRYYHGKYIEWTYRNDFSNYNCIYLWHEIVHHHIYKNDLCKNKDLNEVITMIITDRYLYKILNKGSSDIKISTKRITNIPTKDLNRLIDMGEEYIENDNNNASIRDLIGYIVNN